jgi:hypothetical protein
VRKGRGGLEVHMNLMPPRVSKVSFFFSIFWTFWAASYGRNKKEPSKFNFLLLEMKKDTYNDIFARRLVKTK